MLGWYRCRPDVKGINRNVLYIKPVQLYDIFTFMNVLPNQASQILGISTQTLRAWRLKRQGPQCFYTAKGHARYELAELERFKNQQQRPGHTEQPAA